MDLSGKKKEKALELLKKLEEERKKAEASEGLQPLTPEQAQAVQDAGGRCIFGHCGERVQELSKSYPGSKQINVYAPDGKKLDLKPGISDQEWSEHTVLETSDGTIIDPLIEKQAANWDEYVEAVFESGTKGNTITRAEVPQ